MSAERVWPTEDEIARAHGEPLGIPALDRGWCSFDFTGCQHPIRDEVLVGAREIGVCLDCGHVRVRCTHPEMKWNESGTLLRCTTCGIDGT